MPRQSAEARAAASFTGAASRAAPPRDMPKEAKALWVEIVESRPADFFNSGALELLATFCRCSIVQRGLVASVEANPSDDVALAAATKMGVYLTTLATKLRLTVQSASRVGEGKADEKRPRATEGLLGGHAVEMRKLN